MLAKFIRTSAVIISWSSIFFIPKKRLKKFTPVAVLATLLVTMVYETAYQRKWWKLKNMSLSKITDISFVFGPFFIGTIWIFHLTSKMKFYVYMLVNMLVDAFFAFVFLPFSEKTKGLKLIRMSKPSIYGIMLTTAVVIYQYQRWLEEVLEDEK